jgi:hypothetical protein
MKIAVFWVVYQTTRCYNPEDSHLRNNICILKFKVVEYIMEKEICGTFRAKCGTRDLT